MRSWGLILVMSAVACGSSTDGPADASPDVEVIPEAGADAPADTGADADAGGDAATPQDAGGDAGDARPLQLRIANYSNKAPMHLDLCRKLATDSSFGQPVLASLGLPPVPPRNISQYFSLPALPGKATLRAIDADVGDCTQGLGGDLTGLFNTGRIFIWVNSGNPTAASPADSPAATAGKQTFTAFLTGQFGANIKFDATTIGFTPVTVDPASGTLSAVINSTPLSRLFTAKAGAVATIAVFPDAILVCDDTAPPKNGLTVCN